MYEGSQPYGAYSEGILKLLQTFQNYYKSSCIIIVNKKKTETFCRSYLSVFLSLFFFSETKIFGQIVIKKHYISKEGKNIFYRLLLIIVQVINFFKINDIDICNIMHRNDKIISIHTFTRVYLSVTYWLKEGNYDSCWQIRFKFCISLTNQLF